MGGRFSRRMFLGLGASTSLALRGAGVASAAFSGIDQDFESLSPGSYPSGWTKNGANTQQVVDGVAHSGGRSLKVKGDHGGCWQAIANAPLGGHPGTDAIRLTGSIKPGASGSFGCHDKYYGRLQLRTSAGGWSDGSHRNLLSFDRDGTVSGAGGVGLGSFSPGDWVTYDVRYEYDGQGTVSLEYSIDGGSATGSATVDAPNWETDLSYLALRSGDFTAYWDNLTVKRVGGSNQVPTADFQYVPDAPTVDDDVVFDAADAGDPDGSIAGYAWDFDGDGDYDASGETAVHNYDDGGEYSVALRVTDDDGATDVATTTVRVGSGNSAPTAEFEFSPTDPAAGESVSFDASPSSDPDGSITSFDWDLNGDGDYNVAGETVQRTFSDAGEYTIGLRVTDGSGATDTTSRVVSVSTPENDAPTADFDVATDSPTAGEPVTFEATASDPNGSVARYQWDLDGDGNYEASGSTVEHTYGEAGEYAVRLRVTDDDGATDVVERAVSVAEPKNKPPSAVFDVSTPSPQVGETVRFDAAASSDPNGSIERYRWDLTGDGSRDATGETVEFTYQETGEYTVSLTVVDDDGATATSRGTVTVSESPFTSLKQAHLKTAKRVEDLSVTNFDVTAKAKSANEGFTAAVERGDLKRDVAVQAIRRLDYGLSVTEDALEHVGPGKELSANQVDLTQEMARPTISTSLELLLTVVSITKKVAKGVGIGTKAVLATAKSKATDAVKTILKGMLGRAVDAMAEIDYEANTIVGKIIDGTLDTVEAVNEAVEEASDRLANQVGKSLQRYDEVGMSTGIATMTGTFVGSTAGSLYAGVLFLYEFLSPDRVVKNGLRGDTNAATSAANQAGMSIASEAEDTQGLIQDAKEFGQSFSLTQAVFDLWNDPNLWNVAKTIGSVVLFVAGGVVNAFATGAGIGALIKINTTHHLGLFDVIRG
ncbi:PKD domain-containing protein [Halobaculum sp. D14]|uniref:PKD domain-containing protein n=1 Tax=Halobaculum sp. D14 TaxID=3421642 RepID=UPI003EBE5A21